MLKNVWEKLKEKYKVKLNSDAIALICLAVSIIIVLVVLNIYSKSLYKGNDYSEEVVATTTTKKVVQVDATVATTKKEVVTEPVTEEATTVEEEVPAVIENIEEKVVVYDVQEDAQIKREPVVEPKPPVVTTAATTTTKKQDKTTFTISAPVYDKDGNIIYNVKSSDKLLKPDAVADYITEKSSIIVEADGKFEKLEGYVYKTGTAGSNDTDIVTEFLVPVVEKENIKETTKALETTKATVSENAVTKEASTATETSTVATKTEKETEAATEKETEIKSEPSTENITKSTEASTEKLTEKSSEATSKVESVDKPSEESTKKPAEKITGYKLYELGVKLTETEVNGWYKQGNDTYYYYSEKNFATGYTWINDVPYYFANDGRLASKRGIDVSAWNGQIDWAKVKASGIDFVIIRSCVRGYSTGKLMEDTMFAENVAGARAAGLTVGAYVFSQAVNVTEAREEASLLIKMCKDNGVTGPLIIDVENVGSFARQDRISNATRTQIINVFSSMVSSNGYMAGLYSGENWYMNQINGNELGGIMRWIAKWSVNPPKVYSNMWQYSATGKVPGMTGDVDMDLWIG